MRKDKVNMNSGGQIFQNISNLTPLHRILVFAGAVVILLAVFGFFMYKPKIDRMANLRSEITDVKQKLERTKRSAREYDKYREKMDEARAQFEIISRELPSTEEIPSLLTNISQAGSTAGLNFLLFQPQSENKKDFYAEIPVRMELSGDYHELGNFFDRVARLSRIVNIDNCSTQQRGDSLNISCTAITYRFIGEQETQK